MSKSEAPLVEHVKFQLGAQVRIYREDGVYVAVCERLDLASQGDTREEARANLQEALMLFLTSCYDRGTLDRVLREAGFVPGEEPEKRPVSGETGEMVKVPFSLVAHAQASAGQGVRGRRLRGRPPARLAHRHGEGRGRPPPRHPAEAKRGDPHHTQQHAHSRHEP